MGKKKSSESSIDPARIGKLISEFELVDVVLSQSACKQQLADGNLPSKVETTYKLEPHYDRASKSLLVIAGLSVSGAYKDLPDDAKEVPLNVSAIYHLAYVSKKKIRITAAETQEFCRQLSIFHVWPYWREYVQATTTRMGLPPLTLPLLKTQIGIERPKAKKKTAKKKKMSQKSFKRK